jgi:tetratricopeptide (TPR) repeat protein
MTDALVQARAALQSGDARAIQNALDAISAASNLALEQHLRGRLLAALGRIEDAMVAQERALKLQDEFAEAHYSLGVLLAERGREPEAMHHWERAVELQPNHVDALYNLGQMHYNHAEFTQALESWSAARGFAPNDFEILKKNVQAERALEHWDEANATMADLFRSWQTSADPTVRDLYEVTVDQFEVAQHRVMASEMLRPRQNDLWYETVFRVFNADNSVLLTVQLESSQIGRELGVPYVLGINTAGGHQNLGMTFTTKPSYDSLKPLVETAIARALSQAAATS